MGDENYVRIALLGITGAVVTELIYQYYLRRKRLNQERIDNREVADVVLINELTLKCKVKKPNSEEHKLGTCDNKFCREVGINKFVMYIDSAQYSIDLAMYIFTTHELSKAFLRAKKRGVIIRIVTDKENICATGSQTKKLKEGGIRIRWPVSHCVFMHHKFCVIDAPNRSRAVAELMKKPYRKVRPIIFTGSLNWTSQGFTNNFENMIISSNSDLVDQLGEEFERMWDMLQNDVTDMMIEAQEFYIKSLGKSNRFHRTPNALTGFS